MSNTTRTLRLELSEDDLKEAVVNWAKNGGHISSTYDCKVEIEIREFTTGYGPSERPAHSGKVVVTAKG